jgi:CRP-like cAMP-binding protein
LKISSTSSRCQASRRYQSNTTRRQKATLAGEEAAAAAGSSNQTQTAGLSFSIFRESLNQILNKPRTLPIPRWVSPQHVTTTLSESLGHSAFILVAISYAVDDFLQLRILAIAGSSAMMVFTYFHPHGRVLWLPFKWNMLFIAINGYRVMKVHLDRFFAEQLSPLMLHMHDHHFYVMDKVDFARLVRLGTMERVQKGQVIVGQDEDNRYVRLVVSGELHVERDGTTTYQLHEGNFISESGLHAGLLLRGNVNSCCSVISKSDGVTMLRWDRTELMHLLEVDKNIRRALKAVMSWDIVSKLKSQRTLIALGEVTANDAEEWTKKRRDQTLHRYKAILHNMLAHPNYLNKRKEELHKYRDIHQIDNTHHQLALKEMGWTLAEFESGRKEGQVDEDLLETEDVHGWKWYAQDVYLRLFG